MPSKSVSLESAKKWRRRREARPAEVLEAALDVFSDKGFSATRMEDIAVRAGITKGTIYLYFSGKEEVFNALVERAVLPNVARIEALVENHGGSHADLLRKLVNTLNAFIFETNLRVFPKLVISEAGNFPDLAQAYRRNVIERALGAFARVIDRGIASGEFREIDRQHVARLCIAPMLFSAIWTTCFERSDEEPLNYREFIDDHLDVLIAGLTAGKGERDD